LKKKREDLQNGNPHELTAINFNRGGGNVELGKIPPYIAPPGCKKKE